MKGMEVEAKKKEEVTLKVFAEAGKLEVVFKELLLRGRRSINRTRGHLPPSGLNPHPMQLVGRKVHLGCWIGYLLNSVCWETCLVWFRTILPSWLVRQCWPFLLVKDVRSSIRSGPETMCSPVIPN